MYTIQVTHANGSQEIMKYSVCETSSILDIKELLSVETQIEPKYISVKLLGANGTLKNSNKVKDLILGKNAGNAGNKIYIEMSSDKTVTQNKQMAEMYYPELQFNPELLLLNININGKQLKAVFDTGAQITIISENKAKELGLEQFIDKTHKIEIRGVGKNTTIGIIHLYNISINEQQYPISMHVYPGASLPADMLFGLDNMMRLRAIIDVFNKQVIFGENIVQLHTAKRKRETKSITDLMNDPQSKDIIKRVREMIGMDEEQFKHAFNDVCNGDIHQFEQLFINQ